MVQRAAETYDLLKQRTEELRRAYIQMRLLTVVVEVTKAISNLEEMLSPIATAFGETFLADGCILQLIENNTLVGIPGIYSPIGKIDSWLEQDPMLSEAIATGKIQVSANILKDSKLDGITHYQNAGIQAHVIVPVTYGEKILGVISLQWKQPCTLRDDEINLIHLSAELVAIAITSSRNHLNTV